MSTEVLEHCPRPWLFVAELARVLRLGGTLLLTARGYDERGCYPVHEHPRDYWRFSAGSMSLLAEDAGLYRIDVIADPDYPGFFLIAQKP